MIRIKKPKKPPKILSEKGRAEINALCEAYTRNRADYESGKRRFVFDSKIYASPPVKNALIKAQHGKCFLCESKITHISYGDVEHFRPKGGHRQTGEEEIKTPGYYWLAYDWANLFLACQLCNQRFKKNLFPLENPGERALSHTEDLTREKSLFINPETEDPEELISFRGEIPYALGGNARGAMTIEAAGIDRVELNEMRLEKIKPLKILYEIARRDPPIPESSEAARLLEELQKDSHEYAAMVRANIKEEFRYVID